MRGNTATGVQSGTQVSKRWCKGQRIRGAERQALAIDLTQQYVTGATIRELASSIGRSYGFVHRVLTDEGVELRSRGGHQRDRRDRHTAHE